MTKFKVRDLEDGGHEITGYAIVFDQPSEDMGFIEYVDPQALDNVDLSKLLLLYGHDFNNILARADSDTLTTKVDEKGLFFDAILPNTTLGQDVYTDISNGNVKGASFRFDVAENGDSWDEDDDGNLIHTITEISEMPEISLTPYPAYNETTVQIERSKENFMDKKKLEENVKDLKKRDNDTPAEPATDEPKDDGSSSKLSKDDIDAIAKKVVELESQGKEGTNDADTDDTNAEDENKEKLDDESTNSKREKNRGGQLRTIRGTGIVEDKDKLAIRSFGDYVKTHGNVRDHITTTTEGAILVPKAVMEAYHQPEDKNQLSSMIRRVAVTMPTGQLPIVKKGTVRFVTKEEYDQNPELQKMGITKVDYSLKTYAGAIPISNEMLSDYAQMSSLISEYIINMRALTEQEKIGAILKTAAPVAASDADGLKDVVNVGLTNYSKTWIMTESAYNFIDKLKDNEGRYMFNDSLNSPSGKQLLGYSVTVVPDTVLGAAGEAHAFIGDPYSFVMEAYKDESEVKWVDNDIYAQKLAAYIRADFVKADEDAGKFITLVASAPKSK